MSHPDYETRDTAAKATPAGTASGPYALTPAMLTAIRDGGDQAVRAVALSWSLVGVSRGGVAEVGDYGGGKALEQARRYESYIKNGGR